MRISNWKLWASGDFRSDTMVDRGVALKEGPCRIFPKQVKHSLDINFMAALWIWVWEVH